jgi:hypothetical protein
MKTNTVTCNAPQPAFDHCHALTTDEATCPTCGDHAYEAEVNSRRVSVTAYIFRSWTGRRWLDGAEYTGPTFFLGSAEIAKS